MTHKKKPLLLIGLDAADKDMILKWADEGHLPNLKRLMGTSAWGVSENPPGLFVGSVWPSFCTGVSPAHHGRYCYQQLIPGTYDVADFRPADLAVEPFWKGLSDANKRLALVDVPKTQLVPDFNGIQIIDWTSHDADEETGFVTSPASLVGEITGLFGADDDKDCNGFRYSIGEFVEFRDELLKRMERKTQLIKHYFQKGDWDAFMVIYAESHCIAHQCWHLHDEEHIHHDPAIRAAIGNPIKDIYIALDKAVGELLELAGPETPTIVLASHGFTRHYDATFLLDEVLQKLDAASTNDVPKDIRKAQRGGNSFRRSLRNVWRRLPKGLRKAVLPVSSKAREQLRLDPMSRRGAFQIPNNDAYGGVRINLVGREPQGLIHPSDYEGYCRQLAGDLAQVINVDTGEPVITDVLFTHKLYDGPKLDALPDLMLEWNRSSPVSRVASPKIGEIVGEYKKCRTGDHKQNGLFFITGDQVRPGYLDQSIDVMDYAATFADILGVDMPHLQGRSFWPRVRRSLAA